MEVKQIRTVTITLNEDDLCTLKKELKEITGIWKDSVGGLKECYWTKSSVIGALWDVSRTVENAVE